MSRHGTMMTMTASQVIGLLNLEPHPEGGWYRQSFSDRPDSTGRPLSTAIYYLLEGGKRNAWHRVDATEMWHWYGGDAMRIEVSHDGVHRIESLLGPDLMSGERPQFVIPAGHWQRTTCLGDWALIGCTVTPGFQFSRFELAEPGWEPG
jgi:uncharacterized protein